MKRYPKRPYLISGYRYGQLWLIIPLCLFLIFCKGCGIIGSLLVLGFWYWYSIQASDQEWKKECDMGIASVHCEKGYLESQGFREHHGSHLEEITKISITQEMIDEYKNEIKNKNILGNKNINDVHFIDDKAYVCCGFGIVLIDLKRMEVSDTYIIGENGSYLSVNDITLYDDKLYAATSNGVYYADYESNNLADFSQWTRDTSMIHDDLNYSEIETFGDRLYANYSRNEYNTDTLFVYDGEKWDYHKSNSYSIKRNIRAYDDRLLITAHYSVMALDHNDDVISTYSGNVEPFDCIYDSDEKYYWIGDANYSLFKWTPKVSCDSIPFNGPYSNSVFEMKSMGDQLWVAPGGYSMTWGKNWMVSSVILTTNGIT